MYFLSEPKPIFEGIMEKYSCHSVNEVLLSHCKGRPIVRRQIINASSPDENKAISIKSIISQ